MQYIGLGSFVLYREVSFVGSSTVVLQSSNCIYTNIHCCIIRHLQHFSVSSSKPSLKNMLTSNIHLQRNTVFLLCERISLPFLTNVHFRIGLCIINLSLSLSPSLSTGGEKQDLSEQDTMQVCWGLWYLHTLLLPCKRHCRLFQAGQRNTEHLSEPQLPLPYNHRCRCRQQQRGRERHNHHQ